MAWNAYKSFQKHGYVQDTRHLQQLLLFIKWEFLGAAQFDAVWEQAISGSQPGWLREERSNLSPQGRMQSSRKGVSAEVMQAITDFINADDWEETQAVVEREQAHLFQAEVEQIFERNIAQARIDGKTDRANQLEQHLLLLRACKATSISQAFEPLLQERQEELPFASELLSKSVNALLGSPQEKLAYAQSLMEQANQTTDEQLKTLLQTIQLALVGGDLWELGQTLEGVYRQAWHAIAANVETGGVDPRFFEQLVNNTLAVLGPAPNKRNEWRSVLADSLNQDTVEDNRSMAELLNTLIMLLDAQGNPAGLGESLQGFYAKTWHYIVEQLAK